MHWVWVITISDMTFPFPIHHTWTLVCSVKEDKTCTIIDFIAKNVRPLSRLTLTWDMTKSQLPDDAMLLVRRFQGLRGLFVRSGSQELHLKRLAMSDHSSLSTSGCGLEHNVRTIGIVVKGNSGWGIMVLYNCI